VQDDVEAIGAVIDEMYAMISGPRGPRDWSRQQQVFHPEARQIRTWVDDRGDPVLKIMSVDEYADDTTPFFAEHDFFEIELWRRIRLFGNMAHAWSAYEARSYLGDAPPERRGINSIQLFRTAAGEWRIVAMIWDNERGATAITDTEYGSAA
jgi:hypothetical protein